MVALATLVVTGALASNEGSFPSTLARLSSPDGRHDVSSVDRHRYVTAQRWPRDAVLIVRARGYGGGLRSALDASLSVNLATTRVTALSREEAGGSDAEKT